MMPITLCSLICYVYDMVLYYLHLYRLPTPTVHRHELAREWDRCSKGAAERAAAEICTLLRRHG